MEACPKCKSLLRTGKVSIVEETKETGETERWSHTPELCLNKACVDYAGENLSEPLMIVETAIRLIEVVPAPVVEPEPPAESEPVPEPTPEPEPVP